MIIDQEKSNLPLVSIVIPTHNRKEKLFRLIDSILSSEYHQERIEIVIVDDASNDGTFEAIKTKFLIDSIRIIRNEKNLLVAKTRNIGIINSTGDYIFFVDDDIVLDKKTIYDLVKFIQEEKDNILAGPIIYQLGRPQYIWSAGLRMNFWTAFGRFMHRDKMDNGQFTDPIECDALTASFMVHRDLLNRVGLFNADLFPTAFEEIDFCIRYKILGYKVLVLPSAKVWLEHKKGYFWPLSWGFYYGTRNRLIAHKLWSKNCPQFAISRILSIFFALVFLFLKSTFYPQNYIQCAKAIFKGLWDGLKMSSKVESYAVRLKKGKDIIYIDSNK